MRDKSIVNQFSLTIRIIPFRNLSKIAKDRYTKEDNVLISSSRSIDMTMQKQYARELMQFIDKSPSVYHVIENAGKKLEAAGFTRLDLSDAFHLKPAGRYFVTANGSALIAWQMSRERKACGFKLIGSHSDSPCLRIKPRPEVMVQEHYLKLNTEVYGGPILSTWFDRPLSAAGRRPYRPETCHLSG